MKNLKFTFLLTVLLCMAGARALAYDIGVENADGVTIYYRYTNDGKELQVTYRNLGGSYGVYSNEQSGKITIPEEVVYQGQTLKVTSIGTRAFDNCWQMTSVTIPNSVTSIGYSAFDRCDGLQKVIVKDITAWCKIKFSNNPLSYAKHLYSDENTEITNLVIPDEVTEIGEYAFKGCSGLTSVTIGNSVTSIGYCAFQYCYGLTSVTIPNSVTTIDNLAFYRCTSLMSVTIPNSVTSIGSSVFYRCTSLTSVTIPNSVTSINDNAFNGCSGLTSITIPNSVTSIGDYVFDGCSGLTSVTIGNSVTSIGYEAFYGCSGLTSITIPNSVTSIGTSAFFRCSSLTTIIVGNSVESIGNSAFYFSTSEGKSVKIICQIENPKDIKESVFSTDLYNNATLYVPNGTIEKYKACTGWKNFVWMEEGTPTGIENATKDRKANYVRYSTDGKSIAKPQRGINILKMDDRSVKKVVVK